MAAHFRISASELSRRVAAGERTTEIARSAGVHPNTVRRHCRIAGIKVPSHRGPRSKLPAVELLLIALRRGETPTTLGRRYEVTHSAVIKLLQRNYFAYAEGKVWHNAGVNVGDTTFQQRVMRIEDVERRIDRVKSGELVL